MSNETYDLLERAAQVQLEKVDALDAESKEGKEALTKSMHLVELLLTADKDGADYYDKQERRRIEEERNKAANDVERDKQKLTWSRVMFELAKLMVPLGISFAGYNVFQKRVMKFEETGRISSTAGRELHLPKFMK